jgi:hypothetical protein
MPSPAFLKSSAVLTFFFVYRVATTTSATKYTRAIANAKKIPPQIFHLSVLLIYISGRRGPPGNETAPFHCAEQGRFHKEKLGYST